jgi:hypothetical protein
MAPGIWAISAIQLLALDGECHEEMMAYKVRIKKEELRKGKGKTPNAQRPISNAEGLVLLHGFGESYFAFL